MTSKAPVFSQIVQDATVGRGPIIGANGNPIIGSRSGVDLAVAEGSFISPRRKCSCAVKVVEATCYLLFALLLWLVGSWLASAHAASRGTNVKPDPQQLVGQKVSGDAYPNGWHRGGWARYGKEQNHVLIVNGRTSALVVERRESNRRTTESKIIAAVLLKGYPRKGVWHELSSDCKSKNGHFDAVTKNQGQLLLAEVVYRKCDRYSSNVLSAWMVDLNTGAIAPYSSQGLRCENTYLDSGEFTECKFIPRERQ